MEWCTDSQSCYCVCHEMRNELLGKLLLLLPFITTKSKSITKNWSRTTTLMLDEIMAITYHSFGEMQEFQAPLDWGYDT